MPLTTSLFTGLTGMAAHSRMLDVVGNNISNVNTTAFKRSRVSFETQISQTLKSGSAPRDGLGGSNAAQVGLGVRLGQIRRDFSSGGFQPTGVNTDMAIEGNGFFIVEQAGSTRYTRAGNFTLDRDFNLTSGTGLVQGFGVDENFNLVDGVLSTVNIPIGVLTIAEATENVKFAGNLNAGGVVATQGSEQTFDALYTDAAATTPATSASLLTSLFDSTGTSVLSNGDVITLADITRGGAALTDRTFEVGSSNTTDSDDFGTTVADLLDFIDEHLGLENSAGGAGVTINAAGEIVVTGNSGTANAIEMENANIIVNRSSTPTTPFVVSETGQADGESSRTTFIVYDSLGNPVTLDMSIVLESTSNTGSSWRYYATSDDDTDLDRAVSTGLINFDTNGQLLSTQNTTISVNRDATGAITPMTIDMGFEDQFGSVTALYDIKSQVSAIHQDGSTLGTLEDFNVAEDGTISGVFSNSLIRTLGRIPLAMFANNEGLVEAGGNLFIPTVNSGIATVVTASTGGSGRVIGRATELSNVELSEEFINLISASTGFSSNTRVITTSQQLIQELIASVR